MAERILVTGGAGFVGSNIALALKRDRSGASVVAFDNLKRRGSEFAVAPLRALPLERKLARLVLRADARVPGATAVGISEQFALAGNRSLYGATKLSAELLIEEYKAMYGIRAVVLSLI